MSYTDFPPRHSTLGRRSLASGGPSTGPEQGAPRASRVQFSTGPFAASSDEYNVTQVSPESGGHERSSSLPEPFYAAGPSSDNDRMFESDAHRPRYTSEPQVRPQKRVRFDASTRRDSDDSEHSEETLYQDDHVDDMSKFSLSSYRHPFDIPPPDSTYGGCPDRAVEPKSERPASTRGGERDHDETVMRRRIRHDSVDSNGGFLTPEAAKAQRQWDNLRNMNLLLQYGDGSPIFDPDDPVITGVSKHPLSDIERDEKHHLRLMSYRERRKYMQRARIEYNVTTVANRQTFLLVLGKALVKFAAPSHRLESQLLAAARILEIDLETVHLPTAIIASFGTDGEPTSEVHVIARKGQLSLGCLHRVHQIYRGVVHDEMSAKEATQQLKSLLGEKPIYGPRIKIPLAFFLSTIICPLAFGGSFVDMWIAGSGAFVLSFVQTHVSSKKDTIYANVYDTTVTILISFVARALSSIRSEIFCYSAISSSAIIGILPGFLVLCSALELGSKNLVCGSVNLVYALIVTLFISFGLQIGSDLFLLFDRSAHDEITTLAARTASAVVVTGTYITDYKGNGSTLMGAFTFTNSTPIVLENIVNGCYRPPSFPWYLQPFPWWTQFILVPSFALLCSLANLQPLFTLDLLVMVFISCVGYTANKVASMFIFHHSDIVSAIGAFAIGVLGNIYSRKLGGTAFTAMVPGVLFLVPSGLSQAGGINSQGDASGIDTGYEMVEVVVGIVVGLFISQAIVYLFGNRKNAASFTF